MDRFVWERWRNVWYMGRVVDEKPASTDNALVKIHIHGEADTNDKWFPVDSANLVFLAVVPSEITAIGEFPAAGAYVELFLLDQPLLDALSVIMDQTSSANASIERSWTLVGKVDHVVPAHDASVVDVAYPSAYHRVARERRLHIGNGYIKVISESEYQDRQLRLETALREIMHKPQQEDHSYDSST